MSNHSIYAIASAGMALEKLRLDVVASNIAHQHTLLNADGSGFQPMKVLATASDFDTFLDEIHDTDIQTVAIVPQENPPNKIYQPGHPSADGQGYINYPGISTIDEMTTLLRAERGYEANIKIMNMAHSLYLQALTIGEER
jgi:flagellar basal-body rod protein FlgC